MVIYREAPISRITHSAKVKAIKQYKHTNKKINYFDGSAIKLPETFILEDINQNAMRSQRDTALKKPTSAKMVADLF